MAIKAIAYSYWRTIKRGARTYASIPAAVQPDVLALAQEDVASSVITAEEYEQITGQAYAPAGEVGA